MFYCGKQSKKYNFQMFEKIENFKKIRSDDFWKKIGVYNFSTRKVMGLYKIKNICNQNICTIAINPKEYFEKLKERKINKKHEGVRRDTPGMSFESYAMRINTLRDIDCKKEEKKLLKKDYKLKIQT